VKHDNTHLETPEFFKKLQKRNKDAFHILYQHYKVPLYNLVFSMLRNRDKTADIIQDTFIIIIRKIHQLQNISGLKQWIYRIAVNETLNLMHRERKFSFSGDNLEPAVDKLAMDNFMVSEADVTEARHYILLELVERLPLKQRVVFNLKYVEGFKEPEIAEITDSPVGTVKSRLNMARNRIKEWFKNIPDDLY